MAQLFYYITVFSIKDYSRSRDSTSHRDECSSRYSLIWAWFSSFNETQLYCYLSAFVMSEIKFKKILSIFKVWIEPKQTWNTLHYLYSLIRSDLNLARYKEIGVQIIYFYKYKIYSYNAGAYTGFWSGGGDKNVCPHGVFSPQSLKKFK